MIASAAVVWSMTIMNRAMSFRWKAVSGFPMVCVWGVFALISEIPFDLAFDSNWRTGVLGIDFLDFTNVFDGLCLGCHRWAPFPHSSGLQVLFPP